MNEVTNVLKKQFGAYSNTINYHGSDSEIEHFRDMLNNYPIQEFEAPDAFIVGDDMLLAIEHFEFDCFKSGKKGSQSKKEQGRISRKQESMVPTDEGVLYHDSIKGESSYSDYLKNVSQSFSNHYKKIDNYKINLENAGILKSDMEFKMMFLIDDASPLGSSYINSSQQWAPITLAHSKEFLEILKLSSKVDYVLATSMCDNQPYTWFINTNDIDEYLKNIEDYDDSNFVDLHPQVLCYKQFLDV